MDPMPARRPAMWSGSPTGPKVWPGCWRSCARPARCRTFRVGRWSQGSRVPVRDPRSFGCSSPARWRPRRVQPRWWRCWIARRQPAISTACSMRSTSRTRSICWRSVAGTELRRRRRLGSRRARSDWQGRRRARSTPSPCGGGRCWRAGQAGGRPTIVVRSWWPPWLWSRAASIDWARPRCWRKPNGSCASRVPPPAQTWPRPRRSLRTRTPPP
jgi:hypothetical protein